MNHLMDNAKVLLAPEVGMGATELCWTDRRAYTIIEVSKSGRRFTMQEDKATPLHEGMTESQSWIFDPNPNGCKEIVSLRKDGKWRVKGSNGLQVLVGARQKYYDYSF